LRGRRPAVETIELKQRRFDEVDEAFAFDEGEGDRTLAFWRRAHQSHSGRQGAFAADMLLYCELRTGQAADPPWMKPPPERFPGGKPGSTDPPAERWKGGPRLPAGAAYYPIASVEPCSC
jgi:hypothetical protein